MSAGIARRQHRLIARQVIRQGFSFGLGFRRRSLIRFDRLRALKNLITKSNRLKKDLQQVQSSIADVETNHLLKRYENVVYSKIKSNLDAELKTKKEAIEQSRLSIKELGNQKRWLDWVEKYADRVGSLDEFSNEAKKEYLEGILEPIEVVLDKETNDHHLDITFTMGLIGDGIEYQDPKDKSAGYNIVAGDTNASIVIRYEEAQKLHQGARSVGRKSQNLKKVPSDTKDFIAENRISTYHRSPELHHCRVVSNGWIPEVEYYLCFTVTL